MVHETFHNLRATYLCQNTHLQGQSPRVGSREARSSPKSALYCMTCPDCIQQPQDEATALANSRSPNQNLNSNSKGFSILMCSTQKASFTLFSPMNTYLTPSPREVLTGPGLSGLCCLLCHNPHLAICRDFSEGRALLLY